ncbi:hypothetical protein Clacol_005734 [Clathrus columnatus]|uniref:Uncharacterized protein n=1 Tax=Clathrus columnatus TaxID=1419009 RepID=A0AAV5AEU7_9AGAM|nr:hypothetical protein Clacol_005734 [Clathrus columnatus]
MYDHRQNQVTDSRSVSVSNLPIPPAPAANAENERRIYDADAESRVSTDSDLDLTDFDDDDDDDDEDDEEYDADKEEQPVENRSTFSGVLMRKLRALEQEKEQHQHQHRIAVAQHNANDALDEPMENIRPALLAVADDSFSAKMRRVLKWTHSLPSSDAVSESSDSDLCSPAMIPTAILPLPISSSTESRKRRLSDAIFLPDSNTIANKRPRIATAFSPSAPGSPFFSSAPRLYPYPIPIPMISASRPVNNTTTATVAAALHPIIPVQMVINSRSTVLPAVKKPCDYTTSASVAAAPMAIHMAMAVNSNSDAKFNHHHHHHHHHHALTDSLHVCYGL